MERATALKTLRKILGDRLGYRVDPQAPDASMRAVAREQAKALSAQHRIAIEASEARRNAILSADPEYQQLRAEAQRLGNAKHEAWGISHRFRFTVGTSSDLFFHVKAQGDSWEDVIAQLKNGKARS